MRLEKQTKCDKRRSKDITALLLKEERRTCAPRSASNLAEDYRPNALKTGRIPEMQRSTSICVVFPRTQAAETSSSSL